MPNNKQTKMITKSDNSEESKPTRKVAQVVTYSELNELIQRNVKKSVSRQYTQYAKDSIKTYLQNPATNIDNIREVSRFLARNSTLYLKILLYYAVTPLFNYELIGSYDYSKTIKQDKVVKDFQTVAKTMNGFNIKTTMAMATFFALRDGIYVGFSYTDGDNTFLMMLDPQYCRIWGKNSVGQWIVYFNAAYFAQGNNSIYVEGVDGDTSGCWDECFILGYENYQNDRTNSQWFRLPPERTFCMIAGADDEFDVPLPKMAGLFTSLLDLSDLEQLIADKTELENYKLLISKIPLKENSEEINDFALDIKFVEQMQALIDASVPSLVGTAITAWDMDVITFDKSNTSEDTDALATSIQNLFNNAGISQIVVAGGNSTNSVGLKHALQNDMANIWLYVNREESWLNYYIKENISDGYILQIHPQTWFNRDEYISERKDLLSFGGSLMSYLTACGDTPYAAWQKLNFEKNLGVKSLLEVPQTSYTLSGNSGSDNGAPTKDDDDLSEEGQKTRDSNKNGSEK